MLNVEYISNYLINRAEQFLTWEFNRIYNKTNRDVYLHWSQLIKDVNFQFLNDLGCRYKFKTSLDKDFVTATWEIQKDGFIFGFQRMFDLTTYKALAIPEV